MSFREKIAWSSFLSTLVVWSPYFLYTISRIHPNNPDSGSILGVFVAAVVVQVVIGIAAGMFSRLTSAVEPKDERDLAIEARAAKIAYYVMCVSVFSVFGLTAYVAPSVASSPAKGFAVVVLMSQLTLLSFILAEMTRFLAEAISYRRGS